MKTLLRGKPLAVRFWAHVEMRGPDDCWVFKGPLDRNGYGRFQQGKTNHAAHRLAWILANGREFPPNTVGMHTCDNPPCVNPARIARHPRVTSMRVSGRLESGEEVENVEVKP